MFFLLRERFIKEMQNKFPELKLENYIKIKFKANHSPPLELVILKPDGLKIIAEKFMKNIPKKSEIFRRWLF